MFYDTHVQARAYAPGIGQAVADRTINRTITEQYPAIKQVYATIPRDDQTSLDNQVEAWCKSNNYVFGGEYRVQHGDDTSVNIAIDVSGELRRETWADVAERVSLGNSLLTKIRQDEERQALRYHLRRGSIIMSGRHLQHGDETQPTRNQEVFTNCLDGKTRILTLEHGPVEIADIANTSVTVIAGDGVPRRATINEHGEQELFEIVFRQAKGGGGKYRKVVNATANHRWKLRDGSFTDSLKVGDVIASIADNVGLDPVAVVHGILFGDGTAHKSRHDSARHFSQGRTYASIRVCKQDAAREEIHEWLDQAGYGYTTPRSAEGDRCYYIGKFEGCKDVPFTRDPEYIAGFIYGWWLADGRKDQFNSLEISSANRHATNWLLEHAGYAGFNVTMRRVMEREEGDGSFPNGQSLNIIRLRKNVEWKVESIASIGKAKVYCPEEPVTSSFVLANGLLTGNCATSAASFLTFYLLLNGAGVGRSYDDDMMLVDWFYMPVVECVIDNQHPDAQSGEIVALTRAQAEHLYAGRAREVFEVPDSREGWAAAVEKIETMTATEKKRGWTLILDFSKVRPRGAPINGMQGRPASGPGPLMKAIQNIARVRDSSMDAWRSTMYVDHYLAECVLVGGARRAARMSTKHWSDEGIFDFISVKRGGFLWSSNNSVTIDEEFRSYIEDPSIKTPEAERARRVMEAICQAAYHDRTGEPGLINQDMLRENNVKLDDYAVGDFVGSQRFQLSTDGKTLMGQLAEAFLAKKHKMITNPCGEITLIMLGGYCLIGDNAPYHAKPDWLPTTLTQPIWEQTWDEEAEDSFRVITRALIRTNLMDCLYRKEVNRTNRIGVSLTGLHEYAYARFGYGFRDLIDEEKSKPFWLTMSRFARAVQEEAVAYSAELGVNAPHTDRTIKPAGTTSKLFSLSEGAHLPARREYLRWVQFRYDDPLIAKYEALGYPVKRLKTYSGTVIVGFPTQPEICKLGMGDKLVLASEATPDEQFQWLRLLEKYWIRGVQADGVTPLTLDTGNQVSYTLKYKPKEVSYDAFRDSVVRNQFTVKVCSVLPEVDADDSAYEYLPEQVVTKHDYEMIVNAIKQDESVKEDVDFSHVDCATGACPVDFNK